MANKQQLSNDATYFVGDIVYFACPLKACKNVHSSTVTGVEVDKVRIYVPTLSPEELDYNPNYVPPKSVFFKHELSKTKEGVKLLTGNLPL